jgi:hypothetical protein
VANDVTYPPFPGNMLRIIRDIPSGFVPYPELTLRRLT